IVLGLCGGYQMLGRTVADPEGIEGPPATVAGLGLLDVVTTLVPDKRLEGVRGTSIDGAPFAGYEMHIGVTEGRDRANARRTGGAPCRAPRSRPPAQIGAMNNAASAARSPSRMASARR